MLRRSYSFSILVGLSSLVLACGHVEPATAESGGLDSVPKIGAQHNTLLQRNLPRIEAQLEDGQRLTEQEAYHYMVEVPYEEVQSMPEYAETPLSVEGITRMLDDTRDAYYSGEVALPVEEPAVIRNELVGSLDEMRVSYEMPQVYTDIATRILDLAASSDASDADIDQYVESVLNDPAIEEDAKGYAMLISDVAKSSRTYWAESWRNDPDSRKQLLLPPWAWGDIIGAGAGALSSLWSQRNNAKKDWAEVGGQALIWGASGSLCARLCSGVVKAAH